MKLRGSKESKLEGATQGATAVAAAGHRVFSWDCGNAPVHEAIEAIEGAVVDPPWHLEHVAAYMNNAPINSRSVVLIFRR